MIQLSAFIKQAWKQHEQNKERRFRSRLLVETQLEINRTPNSLSSRGNAGQVLNLLFYLDGYEPKTQKACVLFRTLSDKEKEQVIEVLHNLLPNSSAELEGLEKRPLPNNAFTFLNDVVTDITDPEQKRTVADMLGMAANSTNIYVRKEVVAGLEKIGGPMTVKYLASSLCASVAELNEAIGEMLSDPTGIPRGYGMQAELVEKTLRVLYNLTGDNRFNELEQYIPCDKNVVDRTRQVKYGLSVITEPDLVLRTSIGNITAIDFEENLEFYALLKKFQAEVNALYKEYSAKSNAPVNS